MSEGEFATGAEWVSWRASMSYLYLLYRRFDAYCVVFSSEQVVLLSVAVWKRWLALLYYTIKMMRPNTSKCDQQKQQHVNNRQAETSTTTLNPLKLAESTRFG